MIKQLKFRISHRLTGWNAVKSRVEQLGLQLTDDEVRCFHWWAQNLPTQVSLMCTDQGCHRQDQGARRCADTINGRRRFSPPYLPLWYPVR